MIRSALFVLILTMFSIGSITASDWPAFRGPNHDGSSSDGKFVAPAGGALAVAWRSSIGSGYSGIAVADGRVVTLFTDQENDVAAAFDATSGKELWRYKIGPKYKGHDGSQDGPVASPVIHASTIYGLGPHGHLFALNLSTGKQVWSTHVVEKHGAKVPSYGFSASPIVAGGVLVVELGADSGKAIAGFDLKTGELRWTAGDDKINYQSPVVIKSDGKDIVVASGDTKLFFIDPASGKILLEQPHGGEEAQIVVPVPVENDRLLIRANQDNTDLIRVVTSGDGKLSTEKVWTAGVFKNSYNVPVYYKGYLYGYNSRVFTCVDAATGETKWKSRNPPDGWVLLVDGNLVVQTKDGDVHVAPASPDGWKEISQLELFKNLSWSHPVYAAGGVYTRSFGELARVEWSTKKASTATLTTPAISSSGSGFAKFLSDIQSASDKKAVADKFFSSTKQFPIMEWPDQIHFVYRGDATDVAIGGDMIGSVHEVPMKRVEGTDIFYYSTRLEPDAHVLYRYFRNFDEQIGDPNSDKKTVDRRGNPLSYVSMPGYKEPPFLKEATAEKKGKIEAKEFTSTKRKGATAKLSIYLPANYQSASDRYPTVYLYDGAMAQKQGSLSNVLDNLSGTQVKPLIAVMIDEIKTGEPPIEDPAEDIKVKAEMLAKEIVPWIDSNFRTITDAQSRAIVGPGGEAISAFYTAFRYSDVFGAVAAQTVFGFERAEKALEGVIKNASQVPMRIYLDWGIYDPNAPLEGWDTRLDSKRFYGMFQERGYRPAGGEVHQGAGWPNWRNRTDRWLTTFFPM